VEHSSSCRCGTSTTPRGCCFWGCGRVVSAGHNGVQSAAASPAVAPQARLRSRIFSSSSSSCCRSGAGSTSSRVNGAAAGQGVSLLQIKEKPCKWIYVWDTSGRLFVHAKDRASSTTRRSCRAGRCCLLGHRGGARAHHEVTGYSGHYRPNL